MGVGGVVMKRGSCGGWRGFLVVGKDHDMVESYVNFFAKMSEQMEKRLGIDFNRQFWSSLIFYD